MLSVLIAGRSSPVLRSFFSCYWSGIFPCLGKAKVSWTKWAHQRMSADIECAWSQPWPCIPLLSVNHSTRKRSHSYRISFPFPVISSYTFCSYFIYLATFIMNYSIIQYPKNLMLLGLVTHHTLPHIHGRVCVWISSWAAVIHTVVHCPRVSLLIYQIVVSESNSHPNGSKKEPVTQQRRHCEWGNEKMKVYFICQSKLRTSSKLVWLNTTPDNWKCGK